MSIFRSTNFIEIIKIAVIYYLIYIITLIIHELGHALVAKSSGLNFKIFIGDRDKKILFDTKYIRLYRTFLPIGFCKYYEKGNKHYNDFSLLSKKLLALGGIILNVIITLVSLVIIFFLEISDLLKLVINALININIYFIIYNLIPQRFNGIDSDGLKFISYCKNRKL